MTVSTDQETAPPDFDALHRKAAMLIDRELPALLDELDGGAPMLRRMCAYHLGMIDANGNAIPADRAGYAGRGLERTDPGRLADAGDGTRRPGTLTDARAHTRPAHVYRQTRGHDDPDLSERGSGSIAAGFFPATRSS